jgi:acid phosphatase type 7
LEAINHFRIGTKDDLLKEWQFYGEGLPNVEITDVVIDYLQSKLRASTYGRSVWETDLYRPVPQPKLLSLTSGTRPLCTNVPQQVRFESENFDPKTTYRLQLSDAAGTFGKPLDLATTTSASFSFSIPNTVATGAGYKLRVLADGYPAVTPAVGEALTINQKPTARLTTDPGSLSLWMGETASLTLTFSGLPNWAYELSDGTKGEARQSPHVVTVTPTSSQTYAIRTVTNECGAGTAEGSVALNVRILLATEDPAESWLFVYPIPTNGPLLVKSKPNRRFTLTLLDTTGKTLLTRTVTGQTELDLQPIASGSYLLHVESEGQTIVRKVVKQ